MTAENSFSWVCNEFAERVCTGSTGVMPFVGPPAEAQKATLSDPYEHVLGFYFYRVTPFEFDADVQPGEVFRLRMHCMITPFGKSGGAEGTNEHELRIMGDVLRVLHEEQSMPLGEFGGEQVHLQIALQDPSAEEFNHIWSTQPETTARSSLIYQVSLVPIIPLARTIEAGLVSSTGVKVIPYADPRLATPGSFAVVMNDPSVVRTEVDTFDEGWAPVVCFVDAAGACSQVVRVQAGSAEAISLPYKVWVAGAMGTAVTLRWRTWTRTGGWVDEAGTRITNALGTVLDPDSPPTTGLADVELPPSIRDQVGQAALVAERSYSLESERRADGSDGPPRTVQSNLLLVVVSP